MDDDDHLLTEELVNFLDLPVRTLYTRRYRGKVSWAFASASNNSSSRQGNGSGRSTLGQTVAMSGNEPRRSTMWRGAQSSRSAALPHETVHSNTSVVATGGDAKPPRGSGKSHAGPTRTIESPPPHQWSTYHFLRPAVQRSQRSVAGSPLDWPGPPTRSDAATPLRWLPQS